MSNGTPSHFRISAACLVRSGLYEEMPTVERLAVPDYPLIRGQQAAMNAQSMRV